MAGDFLPPFVVYYNLSNVAAATWSHFSRACTYIPVVSMSACPRRCETVFMSHPDAKRSVAEVCLSP